MVLVHINSVFPKLHCQLLCGALRRPKVEEGAVSAPGFEGSVKCNHSFKNLQKKSYPHISLGCQRESSESAFALAGLLSTEKGIIAEATVFFAS